MPHPDLMADPERGAADQPSPAPPRGTGPPRHDRRMNASIMSTLVLALFATLLGPLGMLSSAQAAGTPCPGGSSSGSGGQWCSSLHNADIDPQDSFPHDLYRGDSRPPDDVFRNGFTARGHNNDLVAHVHGGDRHVDSNYISTTGTRSVAENFARRGGMENLAELAAQPRCSTGRMAAYAFIPVVGNFLLSRCQTGQIVAHAYVYVIDPTWARNALKVVDQLQRERPDMASRYRWQDEWAYVRHIPNYAIVGVRAYRMTQATINGRVNPLRPPTFTFERFMANSRHVQARVSYDPARDPAAHWGFNTDLIVSTAANPYTRGCSKITRCDRGGGG
ncbi:hypothetical protein [Streptomyces sp. NPDC050704]|uniref:hypothetical protein n=1 Tax=Streptomyces sp. NPDC050704 TaxID=3157219 RepID=UPI00341C2B32